MTSLSKRRGVSYSFAAIKALAAEKNKKLTRITKPPSPRAIVYLTPPDTEPRDQEYAHETEGFFNVSSIRRAIKSGELKLEMSVVGINPSIVRQNQNADVSMERVKKLTTEDLLEPCIMVGVAPNPQGHDYIQIDGQHRLRRFILMGFERFPAYLIPYEQRGPYEVYWFETDNGRDYIPLDPMASSLAMWGRFDHHDPKEMEAIMQRVSTLKHDSGESE